MIEHWNWPELWNNLEKIALAYFLCVPLGFEREREAHSVGIRTFPLVGMTSCGYVLVAQTMSGADAASVGRLLQGLVTGIGFIGGGAILKNGMTIRGTSTAASLWNVGAVGAAVAIGRLEIAVGLALMNLVTLYLLIPLKRRLAGPQPAVPTESTGAGPSAEY